MQAGKIEIVASQLGFGVNLDAGTIQASTGDLVITADGNLVSSSSLQAAGNVEISANAVHNLNEIIAGNNANITSLATVDNQGVISANNDLSLVAQGNVTNSGSLVGVNNLSLQSQNDVANSGQILALNTLNITSRNLVNNQGTIGYTSQDDLTKTQNLNLNTNTITNNNAQIVSENLTISAQNLTNANSTSQTSGIFANAFDLTNLQAFDNSTGYLYSGSDISIKNLTNSGGTVISSGNLNITNSIDLDNSFGVLSSKDVMNVSVAGLLNNNQGTVSTQSTNGNISLVSSSLINDSGTISSGNNLLATLSNDFTNNGTLSSNATTNLNFNNHNFTNNSDLQSGTNLTVTNANNLINTGEITSLGSANLNIANELSNQGDIASNDLIISSQTLINTGNIGSVNNMSLASNTINNSGQIISLNDAIISANDLQNSNSISAQNGLNIAAINSINNNNGKLIGGQSTITNQGISAIQNLAGEISGVASLNITSNAGLNLDSNSKITSNSSANINLGSSNFTANGIIQANDLAISTGNFTNETTISTNNSLTLNAQNLTNNSKIYSLGTLTATSSNLTNNGQIASLYDLLFNAQSFTNNANSSVYSGGNLTVNADTILNQEAEIYAAQNLALQGSSSVTNQMGRIESQGDLSILTQNFLNKGNFAYSSTPVWTKIYEEYADGTSGSTASEWDLASLYLDTSATVLNGLSSIVRSGGNMSIIVDNFTNDASIISAGNNLQIISGNAQNVSYLDKYYIQDRAHSNTGRTYNFDIFFTADPTNLYQNAHTIVDAQIKTSPAFVPGPRDNNYVMSYTNYLTADFSHIGNSVSTISAGGNADIQTNGFTNSIVGSDLTPAGTSTNLPTNTQANITLPTGNNGLFTLNPNLDKANPTIKNQTQNGVITSSNITSSTPPTYQYLIQTNLPTNMMNQNQFIGSEYFLSRIGYNPNSSVVLLGDPFYQIRFVTDQIQTKLNQKYTQSGIGSDTQQVQKLYDNAVYEQSELGLQVGIALSQEQIDNLKSDIIWLVEKEVNGQKVLVPEVYLSKLTLANVDANTGSIVKSGGNLTISSSGDIKNEGTLSSGNNLNLTSNNNILNVGGSIKSKNDTNISAAGNFLNITQKFTRNQNEQSINQAQTQLDSTNIVINNLENNVVQKYGYLPKLTGFDGMIMTSKDPELKTLQTLYRQRSDLQTQINSLNEANTISEVLGSKATVSSGGNLNITAGQITNVAAGLTAGNDISLTATDGNINIVSESLRNRTAIVNEDWKEIKDEIRNYGSSVSSGGNVASISVGNTNVVGSDITAKDSANILTGGNFNLASAKNSYYSEYYKHDDGEWYGGEETIHEITSTTSQKQSSLTANNQINIASNKNINLISSLLKADTVNLNSNTLNLLTNKNVDYHSYTKESNGLVTMSTTNKGNYNENLAYNTITAENLNVSTNKINADVEKKEVETRHFFRKVTTTVTDDSQIRPLLEQMNLPLEANYNPILLQEQEWYQHYSGLNQTGMIIVAVAAAVAMPGLGAGLMGAMATAGATTAATIGSISVINSSMNGGDIFEVAGDGVESVMSEDGIKAVGVSMAVAGVGYEFGQWMKSKGVEPSLKTGTPENSKIGINVEYKSDPITGEVGWYLENGQKANWFETYIVGTENPIFQQLNRGPSSPPFADFHDAMKFPQGINQISIGAYYAMSQCAAMPNVCAMFPDLFINVATYGKVHTDFDVYKNTNSNK